MDHMKIYEEWLGNPALDAELKNELLSVKGDEKAISDRFSRELEFGTAGMRGVMGAGTNRMNIMVVRRVTLAVARHIVSECPDIGKAGVAIAYDCRAKSDEFALAAALVLCAHGIKTYLFDKLEPTPLLSFTVRDLGLTMGIVVTSSHNTRIYNGYKLYGSDGAQLPPGPITSILGILDGLTYFEEIPAISREQAAARGLLVVLGSAQEDRYIERVAGLSLDPGLIRQRGGDLRVLYTPLHGTGCAAVRKVLASVGFTDVKVVGTQAAPDGSFPTVDSPNPEFAPAFAEAYKEAPALNPDVIIATDPDSDRLGVSLKDKSGAWVLLTGNQVGVLLTDYILSMMKAKGTLPADGKIIKTVVTGNLSGLIAESYGLSYIDTLTGFKFIAEQIADMEENGTGTFIFGFEESIGYIYGSFVRDKDAVSASLMFCEMCLHHKTRGKDLFDVLEDIWRRHGYFTELGYSYDTTANPDCMAKVRRIRGGSVGGCDIVRISDFLLRESTDLATGAATPLPQIKSDVYKCHFSDGSWFCVRPSGTEPKVKIYVSACGGSREESAAKASGILEDLLGKIK